MHILILGNGFDLAHGLKTKYSDFLNYCIDKYDIDVYSGYINNPDSFSSNLWLRHFLKNNLNGDKWIDLEEEIYNVIKNNDLWLRKRTNNYKNFDFKYKLLISKNRILDNFNLNKIIGDLESISEGGGWITYAVRNTDVYKFLTYKDFINLLYEHLREFTKEFERYLNEKVLFAMESVPKYDFCIDTSCISLLSFNYTNTCERFYKINFDHCSVGVKTKSVYVHGNIKQESENCNLVLGTQSFFNYLPNDKEEHISVEFNIFKKHNQRHKYQTIEKYQELLNELKYPKKIYNPIFHVVGHSLSKSDHSILRHIFKAREKSIINIYYYNEEDQTNLMNNITEIIGEEEVMSKVRFIHLHNDERSILKPKVESVVTK